MDAIFLLHAIVSSYINNNKRLYCCFVDYTKAFDSIDHLTTIIYGDASLIKIGIGGKIFEVIKSMYEDIKCCIRLDGMYSDFYNCFKGLEQGDAPTAPPSTPAPIFSIFVNDLEYELMCDNCI